MPIKRNKNNTILYIFIKIFLKRGKMDNHWVRKSPMKQVGTESFQKMIYTKEGGYKK